MKTIVDYASKVKEQHALNKTLAPVETDLTDASRSYAIGEQFINDGDLFKAKTAIAQHDALVLGTNYEAADDIITQIKNKTVTTDPVPTEGSTNPVQSNGVFVENRNIYEVMGKMGAKAILPMSLADIKAKNTTGTWNDNAYAINGVTFTVNTDSDGFITDIAATGTASADATLMVYGYSYTSSNAVTYDTPVIASIDFVGSDSTARGIVWGTNSSYIEATEVQIPAGTIYGFGLRVLNGYEIPVGGITFKPMIRFASDSDDTYQPYVKTNKELTAENEALTNQLTNEVTTRAALGAHNLFGVGNSLDEWFAATNDGKLPTSYLASETITGTVDKDTNSIVITAYNNTGYRWGCKKINLKKNTSYTFSRTSCDGTIQLFGKNNADDRAVVISGLSNGGTVNSGDYDWWYIGFYPTRSGGYFSITDLLARLETDADTTYQPYAKTNQELTAENQTLTNEVNELTNYLAESQILTSRGIKATEILADGVKTFSEMLDDLVTEFDAYIATLPSNITVQVSYLNIGLIGVLPSQQRPSTLSGIFNGFNTNGTLTQLNVISKISAGWKIGHAEITSSGITYRDYTSQVLTSNTKFAVFVDLYKVAE